MFDSNQLVMGVALIVVGAGFFLLIWLILNGVMRNRATAIKVKFDPALQIDVMAHQDAVLMVQPGGQVLYANATAREWFQIPPADQPNLENLSRFIEPREKFMAICAMPGEAQLTFKKSLFNATSYIIPQSEENAIVVTLRKPQFANLASNPDLKSGESFGIFAEIIQSMSLSLDIETTVATILESVDLLVPSDFSEITLFDEDKNQLIPYRFVADGGKNRRIEKTIPGYSRDEGYSGYISKNQKHLLIHDGDEKDQVQKIRTQSSFPFQSYLGLPLLIDEQFIGTLELSSQQVSTFSNDDLEVLKILSGQAAISLHNAILHLLEQRRAVELAGLAELAQISGSIRETKDLFKRLIDGLAPTLNVEILGLLLYDESRNLLAGQTPFRGMPAQFINLYRTQIIPGSKAEKIWDSQKIIQTEKASTDPDLMEFNLAHLAHAAGIRSTLLVPLISHGRMLGYLQAGNKIDGTPFNSDDVRLISVLTSQAAPIIENAILIGDSRHRTQRSEAMRRIASLAGSTASLDEILKYSNQELGRLLKADVAMVLLLDEASGEIKIHKPSLYGILEKDIENIKLFSSSSPGFQSTSIFRQDIVTSNSISEDEEFPEVYRELLKDLGQFESVAVLPLILRERGTGEIVLASTDKDYFRRDDIYSVTPSAAQLANAVERAGEHDQTDEELQRRVDQLSSISRISRELNKTLDLDNLIKRVLAELTRTTKSDGSSILLFQENNGTDSHIADQYWGDRQDAKLSDLEISVINSGSAYIVKDFANSDYSPIHDNVHSALVAPITDFEDTVGLLHLYSNRPNAFNQDTIDSVQALSSQAAIAINNAQRHQDQVNRNEMLHRRVLSFGKLIEHGKMQNANGSMDDMLTMVAANLQESISFDSVLLFLYDRDLNAIQAKAAAGISPEELEAFQQNNYLWEHVETLFTPKFKINNAYFLPSENVPEDAPQLSIPGNPPASDTIIAAEDIWQFGDMFLYPLFDKENQPMGLISVSDPKSSLRPDRVIAEELEFYAEEAKIVLSGFQNILAGNMNDQVLRAKGFNSETQDQLSLLLHKDLEQTIAIERLHERARRIRVGLDIAEIANQQPDRAAVLLTLGNQLLTQMGLETAFVAEPSSGGPRLVHSLGVLPHGINPEALLGQRNPLHHTLQTGEAILVSNLDEDQTWQDTPLLKSLNTKGFISLPISSNGHVEAAVLAVSSTPIPTFTKEDAQIFELIANQVAIALQNLNLLTETRRRLREVNLLLDFSRQIGSLDLSQILSTLVTSALRVLSNAHAGTVLLWDEELSILIPKASSGYTDDEQILKINYEANEALPGEVFAGGEIVRLDEVDFANQYNLSPNKLMMYREATGGRLPVSSILVPIKTTERNLGVLILDNFNTSAAFTDEDEALISSITQQTALTLENARLFEASNQRAGQLQALTAVAATISSSLESESLISSLLEHLIPILPFDTGSLWLRQGSRLTLRAETGFDDKEDRIGMTVAMGDSALLEEMIIGGEPIIIANMHTDERFPAQTEHPYRSWLGVPLISKGQVIGVIALEKKEADYYKMEHLHIIQTYASQASVALENARLYEDSVSRAIELDRRSQRLAQLNRISNELSSSLDPEHLLEFTTQELFRALPCSGVSAILFEEDGMVLLKHDIPQIAAALPLVINNSPLFDQVRESQKELAIEDISKSDLLKPLTGFLKERNTASLLTIPLTASSETIGLLLVHSDQPHHFSIDEVSLALTISNQAAVGLENARLYEESRRFAEDLERRVIERTEALAQEHNATRTLLRISTALSSSIDLDQVLNRSLELLNQTTGAKQSSILLKKPGESNLVYRAGVGFTEAPPKGGRPSSLQVGEGMAGWVIENQEPLVVPSLISDSRWSQDTRVQSAHRSAIAAPLIVGEEALGALLLFHDEDNHFTEKQIDVVRAAANQFAVGINNGELYMLIRDQAESLGSMLRLQQVESSRSTAMLEGVADGVLVTDGDGVITLFNTAAEDILSMSSDKVVGNSLEEFSGLFGATAKTWMSAIKKWSGKIDEEDEASQVYSDQILLEDGRVVSVRLAPVSSNDEFLGTVSIFRDITHEVEVDRLKSEFVATVSHELRTPLTPIKGYVEFLLMGGAGELTEQQKQFVEVIHSNVNRLSVLVNDLLDVSSIEAGQDSLPFEPISLQEIAQGVVEESMLRSQEDEKHISFNINVSMDPPPIYGNPERVRQVIENLVDNAYHYTPEGGRVDIHISQKKDWVQVDVQDNGIGIFPDDQERIFERFYRGENHLVMAVAGTGLGLPIVKDLIEMHDGEIWVSSSGVPGEGSTFSFKLKAYDPNEHEVQKEE